MGRKAKNNRARVSSNKRGELCVRQVVRKVGNSYALTLVQDVVEMMDLAEGDEVLLKCDGEMITVEIER